MNDKTADRLARALTHFADVQKLQQIMEILEGKHPDITVDENRRKILKYEASSLVSELFIQPSAMFRNAV